MRAFPLLSLMALLLSATAVQAKDDVKGFDEPEDSKTFDLGPSEDSPGQRVWLWCGVYPAFVVLQHHEPSMIGDAIKVRRRAKGAAIDKLCAWNDEKIPATFSVGEWGYHWGVVGPYLFIHDPEGSVSDEVVQIIDMTTGQKVYEATVETSRPVRVKRNGTRISFEYFHHLTLACRPTMDKGCWAQTREKNKIPRSVKIAEPECKRAFRAAKSSMDNDALIAVPARVDDLEKPVLKFLSGSATCDARP